MKTTINRAFCLAICLFFCSFLNAQVLSSFVQHSERWTIIPGQVGAQYQNGGPTNGYIFGSDFILKDQAINWFFTAPPKFTGNLSAYYNGVLAFRMKQLRRGDSNLDGFYDVVIAGANGQALVYKLPNMPGLDWTPYRLGLRADDPNWRIIPADKLQVNTSENPWFSPDLPKPNARQLYSVLANVRSMHIRGEYRTGDDGCALDEVYLGKPNIVQ